jgi:uncharacterized protein YaaQ
MKMVITVIHERDRSRASEALLQAGHKFTKVATTGGFLREGNATLLIGVEDDQLEDVLSIIQESCKSREQFVSLPPPDLLPAGTFIPNPVKVDVGGAVTFVLPVERFERV